MCLTLVCVLGYYKGSEVQVYMDIMYLHPGGCGNTLESNFKYLIKKTTNEDKTQTVCHPRKGRPRWN